MAEDVAVVVVVAVVEKQGTVFSGQIDPISIDTHAIESWSAQSSNPSPITPVTEEQAQAPAMPVVADVVAVVVVVGVVVVSVVV